MIMNVMINRMAQREIQEYKMLFYDRNNAFAWFLVNISKFPCLSFERHDMCVCVCVMTDVS